MGSAGVGSSGGSETAELFDELSGTLELELLSVLEDEKLDELEELGGSGTFSGGSTVVLPDVLSGTEVSLVTCVSEYAELSSALEELEELSAAELPEPLELDELDVELPPEKTILFGALEGPLFSEL